MERRDTQINDNAYAIILPPVRKAMPLCTQVAVLIGPALGTLGQDAQKGGMEKFAIALQSVDPDKLDALFMRAISISKLCCNSRPISEEIDFERHFSSNRRDVYHVSAWTLWECVKDFFPQLGNFTQQFKAKFDKEFQSPPDGQTTTG